MTYIDILTLIKRKQSLPQNIFFYCTNNAFYYQYYEQKIDKYLYMHYSEKNIVY